MMAWQLVFGALMLAALPAYAGSVEGPHVVWMNLSDDPEPVEARMVAYLNSPGNRCKSEGEILFMRKKPKAITPALARQALIKRDPLALAQLQRILKQPFGDATGGFDGIVVYTDAPTTRMLALTTGSMKIARRPVKSLSTEGYLEEAFCEVRPGITRAP